MTSNQTALFAWFDRGDKPPLLERPKRPNFKLGEIPACLTALSPPSPRRSGRGGLAVVRLSWRAGVCHRRQMFSTVRQEISLRPSIAPTHTIQLAKSFAAKKSLMKSSSPSCARRAHSHARTTVEISCHGGLLPARLVLVTHRWRWCAAGRAGRIYQSARFLNGRIDLATRRY